MNEKNHNPDDRMEDMLRQWGVDEASRKVNIPPMPEMYPQRRRWAPLLRWGPPAAAAAMLIVAIGLFSIAPSRDPKSAGSDSPAQKDIESVNTELAETKARLKDARDALADARDKFDREIGKLNTEIASLKQNLEDKPDLLAQAEGRITNLNRIIDGQKERLKKLTGELEKSAEALTVAKERYDDLAGKTGKTRTRLAAAASELDRVEKKYQQLFTDRKKAKADLAVMNARHKSVLDDFRRAYLSAAAAAGGMRYPGRRIDLSVRQSASRGARLLERCAEIRPSVQAASTGLLVDRLEVVLTRLNLLNSADPAEAKTFAALVRRGGLIKEIDEILAGGRQRIDVRSWLLETRIILGGAENVG